MRKLLLATVASMAMIATANATQIIAFGQTSDANTLTATANAGGTQTTLSTDTAISITQLFGNAPTAGFLDLNATSIDAAIGIGPALLQHYSGTFAITVVGRWRRDQFPLRNVLRRRFWSRHG